MQDGSKTYRQSVPVKRFTATADLQPINLALCRPSVQTTQILPPDVWPPLFFGACQGSTISPGVLNEGPVTVRLNLSVEALLGECAPEEQCWHSPKPSSYGFQGQTLKLSEEGARHRVRPIHVLEWPEAVQHSATQMSCPTKSYYIYKTVVRK